MIVSLLNKSTITSITLPEKVRGKFQIPAENGTYIDVEGINEKWFLKSNKKVKILDKDKEVVSECELTDLSVHNLKIKNSTEKNFIFAEPSTDDRAELKKYLVVSDAVINIGRNNDNQIVIKNDYVSGVHTQLVFKNNQWALQDKNSSNGTYVNGKRVESCNLQIGDVIYIMGVLIVIGSRMIAINNPDNKVAIGTPKLKPFVPQDYEELEEFDFEDVEDQIFYRSPRFKRDIETAVFKIDTPPNKDTSDEIPIMMTIGPAITMGMASAVSGIASVATGGGAIGLVTSGCMVLGMVLWPLLTKKHEKKRRKEKEAKRQEKYTEYLERIKNSFIEETEKQRQILTENNISIAECEKRIVNVSRNLWERSYSHNDFLKLRIGVGSVPLDVDLQYPEKKFEIEQDDLEESLFEFCEAPHNIDNVPITLSFFENNISGVIGNRKEALLFANGLILQLATMYSYDEVKLVFMYDEKDFEQLEYTKWLPHVWNDDRSFRFLAKSIDDVKDVSSYLVSEFESRKHKSGEESEDINPYYVIFAFSKDIATRADILKQIYASKENLRFSVITFFDELKNLPKECTNVIELNDNKGRVNDIDDITGTPKPFIPDIYVNKNLNELSVMLSNVHLDLGEGSFKLPQMITFLEMFDVGKIEHLNILTRWKENDPTKTLEAQIGIDTIGDPFMLDLHEKHHGPHGLVAGMTGSGKSEFIMTYILSLAINYHPYEVAFVLIDYKGGGMAKAFENLPHTAGIITNLDGSAINRSLISIQSELRRRQAIFAKASKESGISNIDIYKYQKMYREGTVTEPLQHLFVISDEFAELKTQQPEFMTQLVSAARIGRSLGVHLILATQKPSGVVDDQIWSNSKFKACLKVQDRADSMDMLKRPEAAELQDTGRFYLQVGYNELFKLGQSAWSGAPYIPTDKADVQLDDSIDIIDNIGRVVKSAKIDRRKKISNPKKQIDAITEYLYEVAVQENIKVRPLWLEPIPAMILADQIKEKYSVKKDNNVIAPIVGEYDDPMNQSQNALTLPLTENGNAIVYGMAGSGKTTFLTTMIYSLLSTYTPDEVNLYILDFSSETLTAFSKAPHVGDVVLSHEQEKVVNLIKLLLGQVQKRKKLFADYGGDIIPYNKTSGKTVPSIVVVVNNYAAFSEMYDDYEGEIQNLTREGTKYGIYFVITATSSNGVRFRLLQNFNQMYVLQLTDETDFSAILGRTEGLLPAKLKGRGLCKLDEIYEFQTAHAYDSDNIFADIKDFSIALNEQYKNQKARSIPVLPEKVDLEFIKPYTSKGSLSVPIGVETATLEVSYLDLSKSYISFTQCETDEIGDFMSSLTKVVCDYCGFETRVFNIDRIIDTDSNATVFNTNKEQISQVEVLFDIVLERHNALKEAEQNDSSAPEFDPLVYIITSVSGLNQMLNEEQKEKFSLALEKGSTDLNIRIIIAERSKNISSLNFELWYKNNVNSSSGIWIGNGIGDQYNIKVNKITAEMSADISNEFGFNVKGGKAAMVKFITLNGGDEIHG